MVVLTDALTVPPRGVAGATLSAFTVRVAGKLRINGAVPRWTGEDCRAPGLPAVYVTFEDLRHDSKGAPITSEFAVDCGSRNAEFSGALQPGVYRVVLNPQSGSGIPAGTKWVLSSRLDVH